MTPWTVARQAPLPWDSPGKNTGVGYHFLLHLNESQVSLEEGERPVRGKGDVTREAEAGGGGGPRGS